MKHTRPQKLLAAVVATAIMSLGVGGALAPPALATVPGSPGVAQPGTPVYTEDFSNQNATSGAISILNYTGGAEAANETYFADTPYTPAGGQCDGWILNSSTPLPTSDAGCTNNQPDGWNQIRQMAAALGLAQGQTAAESSTNQVLSEYTNSPTGRITPGVQFRTEDNTIPATEGHYYAVSAYFAQVNCHSTHAKETFSLLINGTRQVLSTGLDPCGSNTTNGAAIEIQKLQSAAYQVPMGTSPSLGLELRNEATSGAGNDVAFDLPQIVDVTPQVDKSFTPSLIGPGGTSKVTLTVTNTDDLMAKNDWFITDTLPAGVVVAGTPNIGGTCVQAAGTNPLVRTAVAGSNSIAVTGGDLALGMTSCTIEVDVTAAAEGTYVNGPANIATNLNPPADATLVVKAPRLELSKALDATRLMDSDQFTTEIRTGSATGPVVSNTANATTTGTGSTVTAGTGVTGEYIADAGATYYLTESGTNLSGYSKVITCVDANGLQAGLPVGAVVDAAYSLVPVAGADISCVLTNTAVPAPELEFTKSADSSDIQDPSVVGDQITYTFTSTNTGNVPLTGVTINDPLDGLSALTYTWPGTPGTLLPGETVTAMATYAITQADIDAGHVANLATTTGNPPTGPPVTPPPAGTDTPLTPAPAMEFSKSADASAIQDPSVVGDQITYTFTSTNTGNVSLTNVSINDPLAGLSALTYTWPGVAGTLLPGQTVTATATYAITQADINAGHVANTATTTGTPPTGPAVTPPPAGTDTPLTPAPAMEFSKSADASGIQDPSVVGDQITYTFTSTNTGNVPLTNVSINDPLAGLSALTYTWPGTPGELLPGQTVTATATYAITQADITAGHVANSATTTGTPPVGPPVTPPPGTTDTPLTSTPAMEFTKSADASAIQDPSVVGDQITYTFTSKNTGNVPLTNVSINDPLVGLSALVYTWPGTPGELLPGQTVTATATYAITQADIDAGHVANAATTTGTPPVGPPVNPPPGTTDTPLTRAPAMEFTKSADASDIQDPSVVGDQITYTFTSKNTGNVKLTGVVIDDPLAGLSPLVYTWPGTPGELLPGQSVTATATYAITQADIDAGHVANVATTTGTPPTGPAVTPPPAGTDTPLTAGPAMELTKTADASGVQDPSVVGDQITYTFTSTNTGNVKLTGVVINDPLAGLSALTYTWPGTPGELLPGQSVTATATYAITQADIDAGHVANVATTTGTPPTGPAVTPPPAGTDTPLTPGPALEFSKSADASAIQDPSVVGDQITYTFTSKNTGNVKLTNVSIKDPLAGLSALTYTWPGTPGELLPGQTVTATATYAITQADIDAGHVANSATTTGTPPVGPPVTPPPGTTDTPLTPAPAMEFSKSADASAIQDPSQVGDVMTYTFTSKNTGNVKLTNVSITDPLAGLSALDYTWPGTPGELLPGQTVTATATYAITQADIDAGHVANAATTTGTPPVGPPVTPPPGTTDTPLTTAPAMEFTKSADASAIQDPSVVGDQITYTFTSKNTGNVKLTGVVINDPLPGLSALEYTWPGTPGELLPGQTVTATATYAITQADINAGHVANTATTVGTPPTGPAVTPPPAGTDTPLTPAPAMEFTKTADASGVQDPSVVGDRIVYTFTAKNSGNVTLTNVSITDPLAGLSALTYTWPGAAGTLLPGQTVTATATYAITQADIDAGHVANSATTTGTPPVGPPVTPPPGTTDTPLTPGPAMEFTKSSDASAIQNPAVVGDVITYTFTAKNSGNVTLTNVSITDPLAGLSALTYTWPGAAGTLLPGQTVTATATYAITQADIDAGHVANSATTTGTPPVGPPVTPPPGTTDTPLTPAPAMQFTKSADASAIQNPSVAGDLITYTFTAKNSGNVKLTGVVINDPLAGLSALEYVWPGTPGELLPGQSVTATATYAITQADIDAGHVANSATTTGTPPTGPPVTPPPGTTDTPLTPAPAMEFSKSADASAIQDPSVVGDVITYTFTSKNTGNVKLTGVVINDPLAGLSALSYTWPGTPGELLPGQTVTATATYAITQADIDAGHVANSATTTGTPPTGPPVTPPPGTTDTPLTPAPAMEFSKSADASAIQDPSDVGDQITYTFTSKNTGNVTLKNVSITDPLAGLSALEYTWPGTPGELLPGQSVTATATYAITQADIDAGHVANSATTTGTPPVGPPVTPPPGTTDTPLTPAPAMEFTKTADASAVQDPSKVGDVMTYTFTSKNTGNVKLTGVVINDPLAGLSALEYVWPGTPGELLPGQTVTATATYAITQADIDAGHVANSATTTGTPPVGPPVTPPPGTTDTPLTPAPAMEFTKSADASAIQDPSQVGDVMTYTFSAKNTGNVKLTGVVINDPLAGLSALSYTWPGTPGELLPGQTVTATATYAITQADIDAGHVANSATTTGTPPVGPPVTPPPGTTDTPLTPAPAMEFTKTADASGVQDPSVVGDRIVYTFTAKNTGNVTLTNVSITDPLAGLSALAYTWPGTPGELLPGQTVTASASYGITQADIDAGHVANSATTTGTPPVGPPVTPPPGTTDTPLTPAPAMEFTKSSDASAIQKPAVVGDQITYTFKAKNSGNVTLKNVTIDDPLAGLSALEYTWPGTPGELLPGQTVTATATYAITQADINAGHVVNAATTTGTPPVGPPVTPPPGTTDTPLTPAPAMQFTKTADASAVQDPSVAGDKITYTFTAKNTGNVNLTNVSITDPLAGLSALEYTWPGTPGELLPGQTVTATATYAITQADIDAGHVANSATTTGTPPTGPPVTPPPGTTDTPLTPKPAMEFSKSADDSAVQDPSKVGDVITYAFSAKNTGNVTLNNVTITDPLAGLSALTYTWPGTPGELLPGQAVTATATYAITQADIDAGHVANSATTTGTPPTGPPVTPPPGTTDTPLTPAPAMEFSKSADASAVQDPSKAGDVITYTFAAKNTGNVTLKNVSISDPLAGLSALEYTWPGTPGELLPGQTVTATATYAITQADIDAGHVANSATTTGTPPVGPPVTPPPGTTDTPLVPKPAMEFTKSADASAVQDPSVAGDLITYTFTAKNTGNVTLKNVSISDPLAGLSALAYTWPGTPGELLPGQTVTATATYAITVADIDAGHVANSATTTGTPPVGPPVTPPPGTTDTPLTPAPAMEFTKSADVSAVQDPTVAGDKITYNFTAKNTGNVTLTNVSITDPLAGLSALTYTWPGAAGTLLPGETVTATATYAITQADIDAGHVANSATTTGTPPVGPPVTPPPGETDTPLTPAPAMEFSKTAVAPATDGPSKVGDVITYNFTAKNTGNVKLTDVSITDPLAGLSALEYTWPGTPGELLPGQTVTATATYAITQADINAGHVANSATTTGTPPTGTPVTPPPGETDTPLTPAAGLEFTKTADASAVGDPTQVGDVITYTFTAKNTGNVPLTDVSINDPMPGLSALAYTWPGVAGTLLPGETVTATATYAITQADINAGEVANTATATGTPPTGPPVTTPPASAVVTFPPVVPSQPSGPLANTGAVLTVLPISLLVVGAGLFLFLVGRRKRSEA
ncbi:hypothetical protein WBN73_15345 [Paenarthrobacter sp. CCNWLY172]|uniref:DUF7507 domain-containing protein n=2 Tax=Paenarthrobacter TaxID=1742992 RepID=UPI003076FCB5